MIRTSNILTTLAAAAALTCGGVAFAQGDGSGSPSNNTTNSGPKAGSQQTGTPSGTTSGTMNRSTSTPQVVVPAQGPNNPSPAGPKGVGTTGPIDTPAGTNAQMSNNAGTMATPDRTMATPDRTANNRPMRRRAPRADRN